MRKSWKSWDCSAWRRVRAGGAWPVWVNISKDGIMNTQSCSFQWCPVAGQEATSTNETHEVPFSLSGTTIMYGWILPLVLTQCCHELINLSKVTENQLRKKTPHTFSLHSQHSRNLLKIVIIQIFLSSCLLIKISKTLVQHLYETFTFTEAKTWTYPFGKNYSEMFLLVSSVVKAQYILLEIKMQKDKSTHIATDSNSWWEKLSTQTFLSSLFQSLQKASAPFQSLAGGLCKGDPTAPMCYLI